MKLRVVLAPSPRKQLRDLIVWWRANRPDAARHLPVEIKRTLQQLAEFSMIGSPYPKLGASSMRRLRLRKTPYHLYYEPDLEGGVVKISAAWSSMRGQGPPLP